MKHSESRNVVSKGWVPCFSWLTENEGLDRGAKSEENQKKKKTCVTSNVHCWPHKLRKVATNKIFFFRRRTKWEVDVWQRTVRLMTILRAIGISALYVTCPTLSKGTLCAISLLRVGCSLSVTLAGTQSSNWGSTCRALKTKKKRYDLFVIYFSCVRSRGLQCNRRILP